MSFHNIEIFKNKVIEDEIQKLYFENDGENEAPKFLTEITEEQLVKNTHWGEIPKAYGARQIKIKFNDKDIWVYLNMYFFNNNTGVAFYKDYWPGKIKWFKFGCEHSYKIKNLGRCWNKYTCQKCGFEQNIDSGD